MKRIKEVNESKLLRQKKELKENRKGEDKRGEVP